MWDWKHHLLLRQTAEPTTYAFVPTGVNSCRVSVSFIRKMHWLNGMRSKRRKTARWKSAITCNTGNRRISRQSRFAYSVSGNAVWKPVRVYNDGQKTIIQMPKVMAQTEAPTLLFKPEGGLFKRRHRYGQLPPARRPLYCRCSI